MHAEHQAQVAFYLTGARPGEAVHPVAGLGLRPALLAAYRDLTPLRHDFPLVLVRNSPDGAIAEPLAELIERVLGQAAAPAKEGERLRRHASKLEQEIRGLAARGVAGTLSALLETAASRLGPGADGALGESLARLRAALKVDGEVVDCGAAMPARLLAHAWRAVQRRKAEAFRADVERLILKLGDILRADFANSQRGRTPACLKVSVGATHEDAFDFETMSRLLAGISSRGALTESRRRRIEATLATLGAQRFYGAPGEGAEPLAFHFGECAGALEAFRERLPAMLQLARAIATARLEIEGEYSEPRHDSLFEQLAGSELELRDLALFPDYLVCVNARDLGAAEQRELEEILSRGLPMKVLVQTDDLLEEPLSGAGHPAIGSRCRRLASMAIGLNEVFVLQTSSSNLAGMRDRILQAMSYPGPALLSVFSGASGQAGDLPPYLVAAAAMESRAFPAFSYDPAAGADWASRFRLEDNPQAERDWPVHRLCYEDAEHQRVTEETAFTLVDFVACDRRYAGHFAQAPRPMWNGGLAPVAECIAREAQGPPEKLPALLMVGPDDVLHKVIADDRMIREARRCRDAWHSLQELGGIHNSHAERLLARERQAPQEPPRAGAPGAVPAPARAAALPAAAAEPEKERAPDDPYIETPRCSSCDECIQINDKMFAYDGNKQARIVNPNAGTYRQLVEAAESCQVAVIHPGKPKNPDEPGLDELLKRAEAFL